ncbi:MAG: gamma-glutamylcyclotransferase, partial [Pseudomonadota bacterium]
SRALRVTPRAIHIKQDEARGDAQSPGLMAALDQGPECEGLAFRIPAEVVEEETRQLWTRERLAPAYVETFLKAETAQGAIDVLAFVADHTAELIEPGLTQDQQATYLATGSGFLGTSYEYIKNLADQFEVIGIEDPDMIALLAAAQTKRKDLS